MEEYAKVEMTKRQLKAERLQTELLDGKLSETSIKVRWCVMCDTVDPQFFIVI